MDRRLFLVSTAAGMMLANTMPAEAVSLPSLEGLDLNGLMFADQLIRYARQSKSGAIAYLGRRTKQIEKMIENGFFVESKSENTSSETLIMTEHGVRSSELISLVTTPGVAEMEPIQLTLKPLPRQHDHILWTQQYATS